MSYQRVIPRDFFNEAKLLNCLGKLCIAILDNQTNGLKLAEEFDDGPFIIEQDIDGNLSVTNYIVTLDGDPILLYAPYNNHSKYPLVGEYRGGYYDVLDDEGKLCTTFGTAMTQEDFDAMTEEEQIEFLNQPDEPQADMIQGEDY
jgi:hypothetical protein